MHINLVPAFGIVYVIYLLYWEKKANKSIDEYGAQSFFSFLFFFKQWYFASPLAYKIMRFQGFQYNAPMNLMHEILNR